ncbi:hypothetical protein [Qipengyuania sphaerica]|uniref:hypothetical protein n=1 Tax=Qipengyuania sphaerica TaxID=2867243 RepID=UPI001C88AA6E|nr:hypothetical protein [Qipengyuania sphaerica]MBX7540406.1 hypothetical protein [Qipengyuania sphaerica]
MAQRLPYIVAIVFSFAALFAGLAEGADGAFESWNLASRYTARVSFSIFLFAYLARPLVALKPTHITRTLLRNRRHWGLSFAMAHTVHFYALLRVLLIKGDATFTGLAGGGLIYLIIALMALTSSTAAYRILGKWWKRLHWAGMQAIWFGFAAAYLARLGQPGREHIGIVFGGLALIALAIRIAAFVKSRKVR